MHDWSCKPKALLREKNTHTGETQTFVSKRPSRVLILLLVLQQYCHRPVNVFLSGAGKNGFSKTDVF